MSQMFFHNPGIVPGIHNRPFKRADYPLLSKHFYYIGHLFKGTVFNTMQPQPNPREPFRSRRQLEHKFSCTLTPIQYRDIVTSMPQTLVDIILPGNVPLITGNVYRHSHIYQNTYYFVICGNTQQLALMIKTDCGYGIDDTENGIAGTHPFPSREDLHATIYSYCGCTPECTSVKPPADLTPYQNTDNYWDNVTGLSISYPSLPKCLDYKLITHHYRHRDSAIPDILASKQAAIANNAANHDISQNPNF